MRMTFIWAGLVTTGLALAACGGKDQPAATPDAIASPAKPMARKTTPDAGPPEAPAPAAEACTLETELVPGVPGSPGHYIESKINPNGHSELAYRMRSMLADLGARRKSLAAGEKPAALPLADHTRIRCSWPTTASDRNPANDGMAVLYLQRVEAFNEAPTPQSFNAVIDGCVTCHNETCRGPLAAIEPLRLPGKAP